jgi:hypothetical protein
MMASKDQIADEQELFPVFPASVSLDHAAVTAWVFQIALLQTAACPIHHNAVMLVETLCWGANGKIIALGKRTRSTSLRSIAS